MKQVKPVRALCESAVLLALAIVLSYIQFFKLPFDGAITLASMLPICLISIRFGIKWGLGAAFCYSWSQILQGGVFSWGLTPGMLVASLLMDFIIAFTVLGLAGIFRKQGFGGKIGGITLVCFLRFVVHFLAGIILLYLLQRYLHAARHNYLRGNCYPVVQNPAGCQNDGSCRG